MNNKFKPDCDEFLTKKFMSDTPRTDAHSLKMQSANVPQSRCWPHWYDFSRQLEREINDVRQILTLADEERDAAVKNLTALQQVAKELAKKYQQEMIMFFGHAKDCDCDRCSKLTTYNNLPKEVKGETK
jgi:hypothetical protein